MQKTAIDGHPSNATKSQRVTYIHRLVWRCAIILGTFSAFPSFLGIIFWYNLISSGIIQISGY